MKDLRHKIFKATDLSQHPPSCLNSKSQGLNSFFNGGLPFGCVTELGLPIGKEGRFILCQFLAQGTKQNHMTLWINGHQNYQIYPPSLFSHGIKADRIFFAKSLKPMTEMKQAFLSSLFKIIVIDNPGKIRRQDYRFLQYQAHKHRQIIVIIQNYFLSNKLGNIWATLRVNIQRIQTSQKFRLQAIRGLSRKQLVI